jgi:hypothetical protein
VATTLPFANRISRVLSQARPWVVLAMLLALHASLVSEPGGDFQRIWLMVHFGLFLLWQPFFAAERQLEVLSILLLLGITAATLWFLSGWMIVAWMVLLLGILGGKVFTVRSAQRGRLFFLVAFTYLLAMLLIWAVPALLLATPQIPQPIALLARVFLPFLLLLLLLLPASQGDDPAQVFDFFYAVLVFQLVVVLVLGSLALMRFTGDRYYPSVALTLFSFGIALFLLAVLWSPRGGFGGLRTYFSRYLMSVGMPFELWMRRVAELAEHEPDSRRFLELALEEVAAFPWMRGGAWKAPDGEGTFGAQDGFASTYKYHHLELTFHTGVRLSPALFLHMRLLAQVVGEFYEGKRRESALKQNAYLQAVHETGARLTHDIKNLLQSLYALTSVAPREQSEGYAGLLQRQLPQLTHRLHSTLEKLRAPDVAMTDRKTDAGEWWAGLNRRLADSDIALVGRSDPGAEVPAALFDSVVDNCLDNARAKREREPDAAISLTLHARRDGVELLVCDTGRAIPESIATRLLSEPIERPRGGGLSIGLYQAARQAKALGFRLELATNRDGQVCFRLSDVRGA